MSTTATPPATPTAVALVPRKFVMIDVNDPGYNIGQLLDYVTEILGLKNDAALSRELGVAPPLVSKIRHAKIAISAAMMLRIHDTTHLSIQQIRSFLMAPAT
ncbi:hypothetical protein [Massilia antarctica]|uniref:hypothetical protein n=1 Tax=Massilia antarctica TaxID=2765360 RepID=UPI0035E659C1